MAVMTEVGVRHLLDNVFNYVEETDEHDEYWWQSTNNRDGWFVAWLLDDGSLETVHSYRYPPQVWGGLEQYPVELTGPARV